MMDLILLIGVPVAVGVGYLVWKLWFDRGASLPVETATRRREDARDWQRRCGTNSLLAANFLQPTQNEILETLYVLDHLAPGWEAGDAGQVERGFLNELALNFPTLRKANCAFPLPYAENLLATGKADPSATQTPEALQAKEAALAVKREEFRQNRAQMNALEQMVSAGSSVGPVAIAPGNLPFRLPTDQTSTRRGKNLWPARLAGVAVLCAAVFGLVHFFPEAVGLKPAKRPLIQMIAPTSPVPTLAAAEPSPAISMPPETAVVAVPSPTPTPAPVAAATPGVVPPPSMSTQEKAALDQQIAASQQRAISKYPALAVEGSEINLRFVYRYKNLRQENSPRLLSPTWPETLAEECAAASASTLKRSAFTQVLGNPR